MDTVPTNIALASQAPEEAVRSDHELVVSQATPAGEVVQIGVRGVPGRIQFFVRNPGTMVREVQLQVFQRSFSTMAADRGLGTYSMRLLGETYLGGKVAFHSGTAGTEFTITLPKGIP